MQAKAATQASGQSVAATAMRVRKAAFSAFTVVDVQVFADI